MPQLEVSVGDVLNSLAIKVLRIEQLEDENARLRAQLAELLPQGGPHLIEAEHAHPDVPDEG